MNVTSEFDGFLELGGEANRGARLIRGRKHSTYSGISVRFLSSVLSVCRRRKWGKSVQS
jgi:hypothetical protein